ncbi:MAG: SIMPL domain-containing protein [Blastocatellia bacterium]|nr:SIMPL domain-containing protein [Blastocatellia bacterium]
MKHILRLGIFMVLVSGTAFAQVAGNATYGQGGNATQPDRNVVRDVPTGIHATDGGNAFLIEANVLMNVKADEYVALFSVAQEGESAESCLEKIDRRISQFTTALKTMGFRDQDMFVDFVTHNKIYDFAVNKGTAKEKAVGFEIKKTVSVHYMQSAMLDMIIAAAAKSDIYDLVKVDYALKDKSAIQSRLLQEASRILKEKQRNYSNLFDVRFRSFTQIETESYRMYFPTQMYSSYTAYESGSVDYGVKVQEARKSSTRFYNPLNSDGFDLVIEPVVSEPLVQCTLYLRVKFGIDR